MPGRRGGLSPAHDQKFFVQVFFRLCETFLANFFNVSKGYPLHFSSILQKNGCSKAPKGPPFIFCGTMRLTGYKKNWKFFLKKIGFFFNFFLTRVL